MSTDGKVTVINPLALDNMEPAGDVELAKGPKMLSDNDIELYAEVTGKQVIKIKELAKRSILGELVQRLGASKVGSSMLVDGEEMIQEGIKLCDNSIADYAHDPDVVASLMKVRLGFVDLWIKSAQSHIKSTKDSGLDKPQEKPQNLPPPPLVPVQININGKQVSTEGSEK